MKKFLLSLAIAALAVTAVNAQTTVPQEQVKKECCKEGNMEGKKCDKPADQQCDDCKAKAAAEQKHECKKAQGMKHECKEGMKKCDKAEGMKHECDKAEGMKHECKKAEGQCPKEAAAAKKDCCKDKMAEGQKCDKPADQQCPDCKEKAKKN